MAGKNLDWRPGPSVCRCCFAEGCYKDISTEYFWMGKREVYSEMLNETFDVSIAYSQSGGPNSNSRLICEPCISRLRDASDFKRQVLECEKTFMHHLDPGSSSAMELEVEVEQMDKEVKLERVKLERKMSEDDFDDNVGFGDDDDDDDLDDQPLTKLATKVPKKESVDVLETLLDTAKAEKRKSTIKVKVTPAKKPKKKEIVVKASASKTAAKPEKKKKEVETIVEPRNKVYQARCNATVILKYATVYPFKGPKNEMICVFCSDSFEHPEVFRTHFQETHKRFSLKVAFRQWKKSGDFLNVDCTDLKCRICLEPFENISSITKHLLEKHDKKIDIHVEPGLHEFKLGTEKWLCAMCKMKLPSLRALNRHTSRHYHKSTCETCGKSYLSDVNLAKHIFSAHSKTEMCSRCKQPFPDKETKRKHLVTSEKCWLYPCDLCSKRFPTPQARSIHLSTIHDQTINPTVKTCPECGEVFRTWAAYQRHFVISHTDDGFACTYCNFKSSTKKHFKEHMIVHTNEKSFQCSHCSKTFIRSRNLAQHMWIHKESKRFECRPCNKQFNQRVSWKTHMKSYHPGLVDF